MQIIDKYGYLKNALNYIERNIVSGRGLQKIAKKARINEALFKSLSLSLKDFSEKQFFVALYEGIEDSRSFTSGADVEISAVDISVEAEKDKAFILMNLICDIVADGEQKDKVKIDIRMFSKNNIQINTN